MKLLFFVPENANNQAHQAEPLHRRSLLVHVGGGVHQGRKIPAVLLLLLLACLAACSAGTTTTPAKIELGGKFQRDEGRTVTETVRSVRTHVSPVGYLIGRTAAGLVDVAPKFAPSSGPSAMSYDPATGRIDLKTAGTLEYTETVKTDETRPSTSRTDTANSAGSAVSTTGKETKIDQVSQAPTASLPAVNADGTTARGAAADGGASRTSAEAKGPDASALGLYALGGIAVLAGFVAGIWLKQWALGGALIAGGITVAALGYFLAEQPWVFVAGAAALFGVAVVWLLVRSNRAAKTELALTGVAKGVEAFYEANPHAGQEVKDTIGQELAKTAGPQFEQARETIRTIKKQAHVAGLVLAVLCLGACADDQARLTDAARWRVEQIIGRAELPENAQEAAARSTRADAAKLLDMEATGQIKLTGRMRAELARLAR